MTSLSLPPIEDLDVDDLASLPEGYRYELHEGNLVIMTHSENGEYTDKAAWYAQRGIPEYWIVDQAPGRSDDDALVLVHRPTLSGGKPAYVRERNLLLSEFEAEHRAR
jgi:hypothetical protein